MTAIETLERAISKLETLRDEATPGEWSVDDSGDIIAPWQPGDPEWQSRNWVVAGDGQIAVTKQDADLIVALSRTVEPMLEMLRSAHEWLLEGNNAAVVEGSSVVRAQITPELEIARAILGEEIGRAARSSEPAELP